MPITARARRAFPRTFKDIGKKGDARDTLYFNAFTEDLFSWDNDLDGDSDRKLKINFASRFFAGLAEMEMDNRIRPFFSAMRISISGSILTNGTSAFPETSS